MKRNPSLHGLWYYYGSMDWRKARHSPDKHVELFVTSNRGWRIFRQALRRGDEDLVDPPAKVAKPSSARINFGKFWANLAHGWREPRHVFCQDDDSRASSLAELTTILPVLTHMKGNLT